MANLREAIQKQYGKHSAQMTMTFTKVSNPAHQLLSQFLVNRGTLSRRVLLCCSLWLSKIRIWTNQNTENLQQNMAL